MTGKIHWPMLLTAAEYNGQRAFLEKVFADRAYHGVIGAEGFHMVTDLTDDMLASLKLKIRDVAPDQYMTAKRFLESLAYEASQPAG